LIMDLHYCAKTLESDHAFFVVVVEVLIFVLEASWVLEILNDAEWHLFSSSGISCDIWSDTVLGLHELGSSCSFAIIFLYGTTIRKQLKSKTSLVHVTDIIWVILLNLFLITLMPSCNYGLVASKLPVSS